VKTFDAWRRFSHLSGSERATVLEAAVGLVVTWLALRVVGFRRWKNVLDAPIFVAHPSTLAAGDLLARARHITRLQSAAARHLFLRTNCLEQAMVLCFLLRRSGIAADLRFGARKQSARLEAHAWVEYRGVPLNEDRGEHLHFLPFAGLNPQMETLPD
jgi:hypothetical protein